MFYDLPTDQWSLKMIFENFNDWIFQGCTEREAEERKKLNEKNNGKHNGKI